MNINAATTETVYDLARRLVAAGISVIPIKCDGDKKPVYKWEAYQDRLPTEQELRSWFRGMIRGIAAIGGSVSGGLECIDFDEAGLFAKWVDDVSLVDAEVLKKLVVVQTPATGRAHVWFRSEHCAPSHAVARRPATAEELQKKPTEKIKKRIETRGEGGYAILPGSPAHTHATGRPYQYHPLSIGDLTAVQQITAEERELLLRCAAAYNQYAEPPKNQLPPTRSKGPSLSPGDDFDRRGSWQDVLEPHGWQLERGTWEDGRVIRPGKDRGVSATIGHCRGREGEPLLHVFSTAAGIELGSYGKFRAYAQLSHGGDYGKAAFELARRGYGEQRPQQQAAPTPIKFDSAGEGVTAAALVKMDFAAPKYAVSGLLAEGLNVLGGRPKQGKSWLSLLFAWAVSAGGKLDGRDVTAGPVLYLSLEDTKRRLKSRLEILRDAVDWDYPEQLHIYTTWPRADVGGLDELRKWLTEHPGTVLVIIDTLAKFRRGRGKGGNTYDEDYAAVGEIKALIEEFGCSVLVIHHTRKLQAEDPFDELSGTLAISGAADGLIILDRKRGQDHARLFVTGRDMPEATVPMQLDKLHQRWQLGESIDGIETDGRGGSDASNQLEQAKVWLLGFLKDYAYPSAEIEAAGVKAGFSARMIRDAKTALGRRGSGEIENRNYKTGGQNDWWSGIGPVDQWRKRPPVGTRYTNNTQTDNEEEIPQ